jgi:N-acyl-D-aspartate/D-glutamate deacylase
LLARTVLYKVGHHGSHNATLKERGLERMTSRRLVAMVPVDEEVAAGQGTQGWKMPFAPLLQALRERTSGRVLRLDKGMPERGEAKAAEWGWFERAVVETDLYLDYVVTDAAPA